MGIKKFFREECDKLTKKIDSTFCFFTGGTLIPIAVINLIIFFFFKIKEVNNFIGILDFCTAVICLFIDGFVYWIINIYGKGWIFLSYDKIYSELKKSSEFDLIDYFEKNKYWSFSSLATMNTAILAVIYYLGSFDKNTHSMLNLNEFHLYIVAIVLINSIYIFFIYNIGLKRVKKAFYNFKCDKK